VCDPAVFVTHTPVCANEYTSLGPGNQASHISLGKRALYDLSYTRDTAVHAPMMFTYLFNIKTVLLLVDVSL
jgi:hypothetical protein